MITSTQESYYFVLWNFQGLYAVHNFAGSSIIKVTKVLFEVFASHLNSLNMKLSWLIIAILGSISMIFTIISLATAAWVVLGSSGVGLWQACALSLCVSLPSISGNFSLDCCWFKNPLKLLCVKEMLYGRLSCFNLLYVKDEPKLEVFKILR